MTPPHGGQLFSRRKESEQQIIRSVETDIALYRDSLIRQLDSVVEEVRLTKFGHMYSTWWQAYNIVLQIF